MNHTDSDVEASASPARGAGTHLGDAEHLAVNRFYDVARLLEEATAQHLATEHGMTIADYEVLARLDHGGNRMRLAVLADLCVSSLPAITQTLVRLEDRGWISREKAVGDARGTLAHLLPAGAAALAAAAPRHTEIITQGLLSCWTADEVDAIGRAMSASAAHLRQLRQ